MKTNCIKCKNLRVTLGWSARSQITVKGSGQILCSPYVDRLLNDEFYPAENRPEDNLDAWPVCPVCLEPLAPDEPEPYEVILTGTENYLRWFLGFLFLVFMLAVLLF